MRTGALAPDSAGQVRCRKQRGVEGQKPRDDGVLVGHDVGEQGPCPRDGQHALPDHLAVAYGRRVWRWVRVALGRQKGSGHVVGDDAMGHLGARSGGEGDHLPRLHRRGVSAGIHPHERARRHGGRHGAGEDAVGPQSDGRSPRGDGCQNSHGGKLDGQSDVHGPHSRPGSATRGHGPNALSRRCHVSVRLRRGGIGSRSWKGRLLSDGFASPTQGYMGAIPTMSRISSKNLAGFRHSARLAARRAPSEGQQEAGPEPAREPPLTAARPGDRRPYGRSYSALCRRFAMPLPGLCRLFA